MEKLIILDHTTATVDIYDIDSSYEPDAEDLLTSLGHNPNASSWMFGEDIEITYHKETLKATN